MIDEKIAKAQMSYEKELGGTIFFDSERKAFGILDNVFGGKIFKFGRTTDATVVLNCVAEEVMKRVSTHNKQKNLEATIPPAEPAPKKPRL